MILDQQYTLDIKYVVKALKMLQKVIHFQISKICNFDLIPILGYFISI